MRKGITRNLILAVSISALGSAFQHGYNLGVMNSPEQILKEWEANLYDPQYMRTEEKRYSAADTIHACSVSIYCLGGLFGGLITNVWLSFFGLKWGITFNNIFVFIASAFMGFSKMLDSYYSLIFGRLIAGINSGLNAALVPMYLSEISPVSVRGTCGSIYQLFVTFSILVAQILSLKHVLGSETLWPFLFFFIAIIGITQSSFMPLCVDSPGHLISKGKTNEARKSLVWLRGTHDILHELEELIIRDKNQKSKDAIRLKTFILNKKLRAPLIVACCMMVAQQFSGINAVIYYSTNIFRKANLNPDMAQIATLIMGTVNVIVTLISSWLVDHLGRKTLLTFSFGALTCNSMCLFGSLILTLEYNFQWSSYLSILFIVLFMSFFSCGAGSIPWFLVSELFPQEARPLATSIAVAVNWGCNFVVGYFFPLLQNWIGPYVFILFALLQFAIFLYVYFCVPETKGKTIDEITAMFE